jgi:hypothetical protein
VQDGSSGNDIIGAGNHAGRQLLSFFFFLHSRSGVNRSTRSRSRCCCGTPVSGTWQRPEGGAHRGRPEDEGRRPEGGVQGAAARGRRPGGGGQRAASGGRRPEPGGARETGQADDGRVKTTGTEGGRDGRSGAGRRNRIGPTGQERNSVDGDLTRAQVLEVGFELEHVGEDHARATSTRSTSRRRDEDQRRGGSRSRRRRRHELRRAGTLTWALIPCHEYATYIIRGPKATYIVHVQGANMKETP